MFGDHFIADRIARQFYSIDQNLRIRFINGSNLFTENHYTTLFAEYLNISFAGILPNVVYSSVLKRPDETKFGCDGIIIFQFGTEVKVGLFEAKWPFRKGWDYRQGSSASHFTNQIIRQSKYKGEFAIWETFYDSRTLHNAFIPNNFGSTCSWHKETHDFQVASIINRVWTTIDVATLLGIHGHNFYQIIYSILMCSKGKKIDTSKTQSIVIEMADRYSETIPIPINFDSNLDGNQKIETFMKKAGLSLYVAINLTDTNKK